MVATAFIIIFKLALYQLNYLLLVKLVEQGVIFFFKKEELRENVSFWQVYVGPV